MTTAIRVFLTGVLPMPAVDPLAPDAVRVRPKPLPPLLVFHVILFTSVERRGRLTKTAAPSRGSAPTWPTRPKQI